ncbi:transcriptional regulator, AraC family [Pseudodesulfovibrio mercurii]|uniref:Transcriptional regulator, AraC family n=1 Tax=Pseudodesulfovibrio mercurii TaxID=641491 RepID=F0JJ51_9BACT|nr:AraC family transcriptional regulator [Pseudodesulfovibrio mercurii]EGB15950.1 transcriptional regulator, AraC family [Pseudodesulfovibrio mercurii]
MGKTPTNRQVRFWRDPDLPGVEVRRSSYREEAFRPHVHDAYSLGFIEHGRTTFELEGGRHVATAGQLVFIGPGLAHACNPDPDSDMAYTMFYVAPAWLTATARELFGPEAEPPRFPDPVVDDGPLAERLRALQTAIADNADRLEKETLLVQLLAEAVSRHGAPGPVSGPERGPAPRPAGRDAVRAVRDYLAAHLAEKVSLDELAEAASLSRCHLLRVFQAATGLPPHAYQNQLRVDLGKRLLAQGLPVSRVAAETGFADQAHFTRVFRQFTGATPGQYLAGGRS